MNFKTLFTDKDDNLELASIITFILSLAFIYFEYHSVITLRHTFDAQSFGVGSGGIGAGHGAAKLMGNKGDYSL